LDQHRIITYSPNAPQPVSDMSWLYDHLSQRKRLLTVNNYYGVLQCARSALGLAAIPDYMAQEQGGLTHVAPDLESPHYTVFLVYPEELRGSRRINLFRDFILDEVAHFQQRSAA
ncbi:MAG: LysR substrate-binding domain-containing protein, partial [Pseudomonadota bacterium]